VQEVPQVSGLLLATQVPPQLCVLGSAQGCEGQPAMPTASLTTQRSPQAMKPGLQAMPQLVPSQVPRPYSGVGHGVHREPQVPGLLFDTHFPLHACWAGPQLLQVWAAGMQARPQSL